MSRPRPTPSAPWTAALALAALSLLTGCVAAAFPVLAGSAMLRSRAEAADARADAEAAAYEAEVEVLDAIALAETTAMPAPGPRAQPGDAYLALHGFAQRAVRSQAAPVSALLDDPTLLQPIRAMCDEEQPALLIDLDPQDALVPLAEATGSNPALVAALEDLRRQGLAIAWMTDRPPEDAGALREVLASTGLDPAGEDPIFVQRYPGEAKQARRRALGETHCVIAMAGDERKDFDDLYQYVRDPAAAQALEPMLGHGWFLIPNPID